LGNIFKKAKNKVNKSLGPLTGGGPVPLSKKETKSEFGKIDTLGGLGPSATEFLTGREAAAAAEAAAQAEEDLNNAAIAEQRRQFDTTYAQQLPYLEAGAAMLPYLAQGATVDGFGNSVQDIMNNSQVSDIRNQVIGQEMGGINRDLSGLGNLRASEALAIDDLLNNRRQSLAGRGQTAATNTANYGQNKADMLSNLLASSGASQAQGIMGAQNARSQGTQNTVNLMAGLSDYFRK